MFEVAVNDVAWRETYYSGFIVEGVVKFDGRFRSVEGTEMGSAMLLEEIVG